MTDTQFALNTLMFFIHKDEIRSSRIKRIVIDENGHNYIFLIDNVYIEKNVKCIAKTKEDLFNNLVNKFLARKN